MLLLFPSDKLVYRQVDGERELVSYSPFIEKSEAFDLTPTRTARPFMGYELRGIFELHAPVERMMGENLFEHGRAVERFLAALADPSLIGCTDTSKFMHHWRDATRFWGVTIHFSMVFAIDDGVLLVVEVVGGGSNLIEVSKPSLYNGRKLFDQDQMEALVQQQFDSHQKKLASLFGDPMDIEFPTIYVNVD